MATSGEGVPGASMNLSVKQLDGITFGVSMTPEATVGELKLAILQERDIPPERQRLIFRAQELKVESKVLAEYGLADGATLHIVIRPVGSEQPSPYNPPDAQRVIDVPPQYLAPGPDQQQQHEGGWGVDPNAVAISRLCRFVRIFALIDGIFLILIALSIWPAFILAMFAVAGYFGAKRLQNNYLVLYMICLVCEMGFRVFLMFLPKTKAYESVLYGLMIVIDCFVLKCVIQLYKAIPTLDQQTRDQVLIHNSMGLF